jgi:hypothetical protein
MEVPYNKSVVVVSNLDPRTPDDALREGDGGLWAAFYISKGSNEISDRVLFVALFSMCI